MKHTVCAVFDDKAQFFGQPFFQATESQAIRSFTDLMSRQDENNMMYKHPEDFNLYKIAVYDDSTGMITALEAPKLLIMGIQTKGDQIIDA